MWAEFFIFVKSTFFRKAFKESSLVKDNIITEDGIYCIDVRFPESDDNFCEMVSLNPQSQYEFEKKGYIVEFNPFYSDSEQFKIYYSNRDPVEDASISVYRLI